MRPVVPKHITAMPMTPRTARPPMTASTMTTGVSTDAVSLLSLPATDLPSGFDRLLGSVTATLLHWK